MREPRRKCRRSAPCPQRGPCPPLLLAPSKLVDVLRDIDIESRISRSRVLDQALNALGVLLALSQHCLGAADRKVVHERRSRPIGLDEWRHPVQRLCERLILRDGYADESCRHSPMVAPRCNTKISPVGWSFDPFAGRVHTRTRISGEMDLIGVLSNHDLQGSLGRLARKLAAVRASGGPRRRAVACRQRPRRPGWVLKAVVQVLADQDEPMRAKDIHAAVEASQGSRCVGPRSRLPWLPTSWVLRPASCEWRGAGTCWRAAGAPPRRQHDAGSCASAIGFLTDRLCSQ